MTSPQIELQTGTLAPAKKPKSYETKMKDAPWLVYLTISQNMKIEDGRLLGLSVKILRDLRLILKKLRVAVVAPNFLKRSSEFEM